MKIGILTRNHDAWCSTQLSQALQRLNVESASFSFSEIVARVKLQPEATFNETNMLKNLDGLIVRPIGRGSLEEVIFRMDLLHRLERLGLFIVNSPLSIERSVDKYHTLALMEEQDLPVPETIVTESPDEAVKAFHELGSDVVIKPIFGSRGIGSTRVSDADVAERLFRAIVFYHGVLYVQKFIPHGDSDVRAFVVGNRVIAAMRRVMPSSWKTNVSLGAKPVSMKPNEEIERLAVKAAEVIGCKIAGVDILDSPDGPVVIELNSQPGWRGLQTVAATNIGEEIARFMVSSLKT